MTPVSVGFNSGKLRECVVHVKGFVVQNVLKYGARRRIVVLNVDPVFYDLTSTYFEGNGPVGFAYFVFLHTSTIPTEPACVIAA